MSGSMIERETIVAGVVAAAGGRLTGRVRLQKVVYLLDRLGLQSGFSYEYHHFGPFSRELDSATADAQAFLGLREEFAHRDIDGARYSVFSFSGNVSDDAFGSVGRERAHSLIGNFVATNVTVLELAATIDWLWREERLVDWRTELVKRKGQKLQNGKLERAVELLETLGLNPPESRAQAQRAAI